MSLKLAFILSLALSAVANYQPPKTKGAPLPADEHHYYPTKARRAPSPTIPPGGFPYPSGPAYDPVPLSEIVPLSADFSANTLPVRATYSPGIQPPIPNAPPLPTFRVDATAWPTDWTVPPAIDSDEVKEWLKVLEGANIPNIPINKKAAGGNGVTCEDNPDAVKNADTDRNCWWTCGGCMRDSDISTCKDRLTWGHTYDDGPGLYTNKLLTYLGSQALNATFFVLGPHVITHPEIVVYQYMNGHELGVHTWSHPALTTLTNEQIVAELGWARLAIKDVTGVTPLLFRPPYGDIDDRVRAVAKAMNLTPVMWTSFSDNTVAGGLGQCDSGDWRVHGGGVSAVDNQQSFYTTLDKARTFTAGIIVLQHDAYVETVDIAIGATIPDNLVQEVPFKMQSVQVCQGEPIGNAYAETTNKKR